jgi:hypothetical protein
MKLAPLIPFSGLNEEITRNYTIQAGATVSRSQIELRFKIEAKTSATFSEIIFPEPVPHGHRKDELWKSTCFEGFIPSHGTPAYLEFNGASNGDWNWYAFEDYRKEMKPIVLTQRLEPCAVSLSKSNKDLEMCWVLPLAGVAQGLGMHVNTAHVLGPLGLTVVLQTKQAVTYWALAHTGPKPDFHQRASFRYDPIRN